MVFQNLTGNCKAYPFDSFFRLTAALNRRIPVRPQPRIEGRGQPRVRVCGPTPRSLEQKQKCSNHPWEGINSRGRRSSQSARIVGKLRFAAARKYGTSAVLDGRTAAVENMNRLLRSFRLTGATIVYKTAASQFEHRKRPGPREWKNFPGQNLIFTAGNPPEGQQ